METGICIPSEYFILPTAGNFFLHLFIENKYNTSYVAFQ